MGCVCTNSGNEQTMEFIFNKQPTTSKKEKRLNPIRVKAISQKTDFESNKGENEEDLFTRDNSKIIEKKPFNLELFEEINLLRTDPEAYREKIQKYLPFIKATEEGKRQRNYLEVPSKTIGKIYLNKGEKAFSNCVEFLESTTSLEPLIYRKELEIDVPLLQEEAIKREKITELINIKCQELFGKYQNYGFHFDLNVMSSELSTVLQVVDDGNFHGQRQNNLLSYNFKYIGITNSQITDDANSVCIYLNFAC
jgi:hypothetical protein